MNPPRSVYDAARRRTMEATQALRHGVVSYNGSDYTCAVSLDNEGYEITDRGQNVTHRIRVTFSKRELPVRPVKGKSVTYLGMVFEIELIGGDMEGDPGWVVSAFRTPGAE